MRRRIADENEAVLPYLRRLVPGTVLTIPPIHTSGKATSAAA